MTFSRFRSRLLERNGIVLEREFSSDGPVFGFPGELKQVFLNLIGNAIQAMPEGGRLRIQVSEAVDKGQQREGVRVLISDTGSGIRPEDQSSCSSHSSPQNRPRALA